MFFLMFLVDWMSGVYGILWLGYFVLCVRYLIRICWLLVLGSISERCFKNGDGLFFMVVILVGW